MKLEVTVEEVTVKLEGEMAMSSFEVKELLKNVVEEALKANSARSPNMVDGPRLDIVEETPFS